MNEISKPANISGGATLIGEPSWADVIPAIEKADDLDPADKRHLPTSLRQMALYLGRPLTMIPTRIAAIGPPIKRLHPRPSRGQCENLRQPSEQRPQGSPLV